MNGYASRKFLTTNIAIFLGTCITLLGMYINAEINAGYYVLLGLAIASYNWANAKGKSNGN